MTGSLPEASTEMRGSKPHTINNHGQPIGQPVPGWGAAVFPKHVPIDGHYCRLEPLDVKRHTKNIFAAFAEDKDGKNWTYLPYGPFSTLETFSQWLESIASSEDPQFYTIVSNGTAEPVGVASFLRIDPGNGSIEVGHIHFSETIKRTPVATEAMYLMMKIAFGLGYRRYEWKCDVLNAASRSAAQRLGFSFEGIFQQTTVYKGRNRDTAWFAALDSDWPDLRTAFLQWLSPENFDGDGRQHKPLSQLTQPFLRTKSPVLQSND